MGLFEYLEKNASSIQALAAVTSFFVAAYLGHITYRTNKNANRVAMRSADANERMTELSAKESKRARATERDKRKRDAIALGWISRTTGKFLSKIDLDQRDSEFEGDFVYLSQRSMESIDTLSLALSGSAIRDATTANLGLTQIHRYISRYQGNGESEVELSFQKKEEWQGIIKITVDSLKSLEDACRAIENETPSDAP